VSMFYYLRIAVAMYLQEGFLAETAVTPALRLVTAICLVVTLVIGFFPDLPIRQVIDSSHQVMASAVRR
jgi:NADH:ubiquinone oxidoreductase subunit 2 (subunit N)